MGDLRRMISLSQSYPDMPLTETNRLFSLYHHTHNPSILDKIVCGHLYIVRILCLTDFRKMVSFLGEDLFQEGCVGLLEAAHRYNPQRGNYPTYARRWIINSMHTLVHNRDRGQEHPLSLDVVRVLAFSEPDPTNYLLTDQEFRNLHTEIGKLDPRLQRTVRLYYGLNGVEPRTFKQIGLILGVCENQARNYHRKALDALGGRGSGHLGRTMRHGTQYAHDVRGCRCEDCQDWHILHLAARRHTYAYRRGLVREGIALVS